MRIDTALVNALQEWTNWRTLPWYPEELLNCRAPRFHLGKCAWVLGSSQNPIDRVPVKCDYRLQDAAVVGKRNVSMGAINEFDSSSRAGSETSEP